MGKKVYSDKTSARDNTRVVLPIQSTFVPRFKPITENTDESFTENLSESAKNYLDVFDRVGGKDIFKRLSNARMNIANKYFIPYIPEKRVRLTTGRYNTGVISTNILDSIYDASQRTGVPFDIALGLAGRESTIGIGRGLHKNKGVTGTDLYSNWQQTGYVHSKQKADEYNDVIKKIRNDYKTVTDEEYDKASAYLNYVDNSLNSLKELDENPIDNALKFYQSGKYNPGDKKHTQMVEEDAKIIMSDPAIQKWYQNKIGNQMKCGGRRKAQLGLDIREGGIAKPIAPNMYYMIGRSHDDGGIAIGPNNKNGLEVEGGEVVKVGNKDIKVFSSVPLLRGVSPAQLVMGGANPNKVFKAQEDFKDRNRINDDGTTYETGGEKIYTPSKAIQKQLQETGKVTIGGAPTIGGLRSFSYLKGLTKAIKYPTIGTNIIRNIGNRISKRLIDKSFNYNPDFKPMSAWKYALGRTLNQQVVGQRGSAWVRTAKAINDAIGDEEKEMKAGGIYIKPSKRGTFTAAATKRGMGVQEFASKVLANKEDYSPAMVKKANFARNASRWKKEFGGSMIYSINGNVKNGLMSARPKAQYGKEKKINKDTKIGEDGLIYTRAIDGDWYTDGTRYEDSKYYMGRKSAQQYSREKIKAVPKTQTLDEVVVTATKPKSKEEQKVVTTQGDNDKIITETIEGVQVDYPRNKSSYKPFTYKKYKDGNLVKVYSNADTRMNNAYVRPDREGVNYKPKSYNPLTGETVNDDGVVETSMPSVNGITKISQSSTPRGRVTSSTPASRSTAKVESPKPATATNPMEARYASRVQKGTTQEPVKTEKAVTEAVTTPDQVRYTRATGFKGGTSPSSTNGQEKTEFKERLIPQFKSTTPGDWIGLGANVLGSIGSYFITKSAIDKMPTPYRPAVYQAAKLKTKYNIEPQLSESREAEQMNRAAVSRNTQSSKASIARQQRIINEARNARNILYGQKENIETQLINQDKMNRQAVANQNIAAYNEYLNKLYAGKLTKNQAKISNVNNLISGLTGGVNSILGTIESRRATNNTLRAIAAANPNVDARLLGIGDYYIGEQTKKKYDKFGNLKR